MNCIDFKEDKITFPALKGGEDRAFSIPMPSVLRPLFNAFAKPSGNSQWNFHSSRCAGAPREAAMRWVNHASELIHQVYQRGKVEGMAQWRDVVQFPS